MTEPINKNSLLLLLKAIRVHQWVKNLLLFVPAVMAHRALDPDTMLPAALAFIAFSLCASAVYVLNDLLDLEADRAHRSKRNRPFASGQLSVSFGYGLILPLLMGSVAAAWTLPRLFLAVLSLYFLITLAYSLGLKRLVAADIVTLAILYTVRILAGGVACTVEVSQWLLAFSMFFFVSMACVKRFSELRMLRESNETGSKGRGYLTSDLELVGQCGSASGYLSVLVLALYVSSKEVTVLYSYPQIIWLVCPLLLYWITRIWVLAHRGIIHDDPIIFAITDKVSYLVGVLAFILLLCAV